MKSPGDWPGLDFDGRYYIFDLQVLVEAFQIPPALSQSAFVLAVDTSPAKADVAKATPRASAKAYAMVLMGFLPVLLLQRGP
jgi:hypothetical protein